MNLLNIKTSYGKMRVYKQGSGDKVVVLLHGAGCDHAMLSWGEVLAQFDETFTVYAPDLLGYGLSDEMTLRGDFYGSYEESLKECVDTLGLKQFVLAGLSMGGALAIGFSLKYADRVLACVPVNTWGVSQKLPLHKLSHWYIQHTNMTQLQYRFVAKSTWLAKWFVQYALIYEKARITNALIAQVIEACKGDAAGQSMQQFQRNSVTKTGTSPFYVEQLKQLQMPVVFVHGEKDPLVSLADVKTAVANVPNGRLVVFPKCKHWSVKERPQQFVQLISALF